MKSPVGFLKEAKGNIRYILIWVGIMSAMMGIGLSLFGYCGVFFRLFWVAIGLLSYGYGCYLIECKRR